jgi:hypothetical protein
VAKAVEAPPASKGNDLLRKRRKPNGDDARPLDLAQAVEIQFTLIGGLGISARSSRRHDD